ncbi:hypothetical protein OROGR_002043 [Orobanche gracilis]
MSEISIGHLHHRPCLGERRLRRCRTNGETNKVSLIDVDTDNFDNVVIIDVPESLLKKTKTSSMHRKDKSWSVKNVIYIDDDENHDRNHPSDENNANFYADTSSNRESCHVTKKIRDYAFEESRYDQDTANPVSLSKCNRTYYRKCCQGNRYGLSAESESDSADNDCPDCELDSSGKVQEQWEKASSRRKKNLQNVHSDNRVHDTTLLGFSTGELNNEKNGPSRSRTKEDTNVDRTHAFHISIDHPGSSNRHIETYYVDFAFSDESDKTFDDPTSEIESCPPKYKSRSDVDSCCGKSNLLESEATIHVSKYICETDKHENCTETATGKSREREHLEPGQSRATGGAREMVNLMPKKCRVRRSKLHHKHTDRGSAIFSDVNGSFSGKSPSSKGSRNTHIYEAKLQEDISMSNIQQEEEDGQLHSQNGDTVPSVETCIINEREKLKETDEYKRATEEEWASRQQALQIQAEEAKRLRRLQKRKKTESLRLLDMERRQKERLEEVRNSQKKDEEDMNLKERVRAEVRMELNKLEVSSHSMAFLLHLLGISVGGWPNPMPQQVQAAYKRALLTFHPDRASQSDIRQQVEAEEKFKLINRLKEKFSPNL